MSNITIISDAFDQGGRIPVEYTCNGKNKSPQLTWTGIPERTASIALFMYDLDSVISPVPKSYIHWVIYNLSPSIRGLPKWIPDTQTLTPWPFGNGAYQALNDFGKVGYVGPCPPPGKTHRYIFKVYALSTILDIPPGSSNHYVSQYMEGDVLATGELMGIYERR